MIIINTHVCTEKVSKAINQNYNNKIEKQSLKILEHKNCFELQSTIITQKQQYKNKQQ